MKEILEILKARAIFPGLPFALATVVRVEGSSYRRPGARMLIGMNGRVAGSVSGGCLEKDVVSKGLKVLMTGESQLVSYDTTDQDDLALGASLGCHGRIEIAIEPILPERPWPLEEMARRVLERQKPCAFATIYAGRSEGATISGQCLENTEAFAALMEPHHVSDLRTQMEEVLRARKARPVTYESSSYGIEMLLERIAPPLSLFLFGGGHDVSPLVRLARELGHRVTVIDRRAEFADPLRFPDADRVLHAKPREVLQRISFPDQSAVVLMNHHYETDRELLGILRSLPVSYLGMLGPRKRTMKILKELEQEGIVLSAEELEKLHAPAGLDIGSENPEEIALSILAEIQAVLAGYRAASLRDRALPIHASEQEAKESPCPALASSF